MLDDADARCAFDAWEAARADIVEKSNFMSDKTNLEPRSPPRRRCRERPPARRHDPRRDRPGTDTIRVPYPERTIRTFQSALASSPEPAEQSAQFIRVIRDLGLHPYVPPEPLPEVTHDVYCVTWLASV